MSIINKMQIAENGKVNVSISVYDYLQLVRLGILNDPNDEECVRAYNCGTSNYAEHLIQPWSIILDYNLDYFDGDIIKRVLRTKPGEKELDYQKIIHICKEKLRISQVDKEINKLNN